MKKGFYRVSLILALGASVLTSSCIGSFSLTNQVLEWNKSVGNKFVNELVFFAFCIIPVYEVTALSDILVLNSIEFWSGTNPVTASSKVVEGQDGKYLVECDGKGYTITSENDGSVTRLEYEPTDCSWAIVTEEGKYKFMTFVDAEHVKMIDNYGNYQLVELSQRGVLAYETLVKSQNYWAKK